MIHQAKLKLIEEIALEDERRICNHSVKKAVNLQLFLDAQESEKRQRERNKFRKERRNNKKSALTSDIMAYVKKAAPTKKGALVISLLEIARFFHSQQCDCSLCEYVRHMRAAAAGVGHLLKSTHHVSFSQYDNTITLTAVA